MKILFFFLICLAMPALAQTPQDAPQATPVPWQTPLPVHLKPRNYPKDPPAETPRPERWPSSLRVVGNRLHDSVGREVWLQGVNVPGLEIDPTGHGVLRSMEVALDDWKSNVIRLPIKDEFWKGAGTGKRTQSDGGAAYRALVDAAVVLAANRGKYLVLDHHRYRAPKTEHVAFWEELALRYKDHPAVLFGLLNEPHGISWKVWRDGGFVATKTPKTDETPLGEAEPKAGFESPGHQKLVDVIRATGAKNVVVAGGLDWAYDLSGIVNGFALEDRSGNGIVYDTHIYPWKKGWAKKVLAAAAKHPILVGEVGADLVKMPFLPPEAHENPFIWSPDVLGWMQKHRLNWTGWSFHAWATPVMISDWNYTPTPFWGEFAKRALAGETFPEPEKLR